jgi:hypothetical protein
MRVLTHTGVIAVVAVPPATAEKMYHPETFCPGRSDRDRIE